MVLTKRNFNLQTAYDTQWVYNKTFLNRRGKILKYGEEVRRKLKSEKDIANLRHLMKHKEWLISRNSM